VVETTASQTAAKTPTPTLFEILALSRRKRCLLLSQRDLELLLAGLSRQLPSSGQFRLPRLRHPRSSPEG